MSEKFHCLMNLSLQLAVPSQRNIYVGGSRMIKTGIYFLLCLSVVASTTGCLGRRMAAQSTVDAMRAEQMELVDRYYRLESNYRKAERELERLRKIHGVEASGDEGTSESTDEPDSTISSNDSQASPQGRSSSADKTLRYEDPADEFVAIEQAAKLRQLARDEGDARELLSVQEISDSSQLDLLTTEVDAEIRDWRVTHVVVNPLLTKGRNIDGHYGDDGLTLVIEPRNADDDYVPAAGPLTISVIDPEESGEEQRIGLWNLTSEEVEPRVYYPGESGQGIQLTLPWQVHSPRHRKLLIFVRYETSDGELLETSGEVRILLPQAGISSWQTRQTPIMQVDHQEDVEPASEVRQASALEPAPPVREGSRIPPSRLARPRWSPYR